MLLFSGGFGTIGVLATFLCFLIFFTILLAILLLCVPYVLYEIIQPINTDLEKGGWNTLICYLNCISSVRPTNQTILIIREIINFEKATLFECFKAMDNYKDQVYFPNDSRNF